MAKLGDLGQIITGNTPKTTDAENYASKDIAFIKPSDIQENKLTMLSRAEFYISEYAREKARILIPGCILVTCIGIVGKVAINNIECAFNQQINAIVPDTKKCDTKYIAYAIQSQQHRLQDIANAAVVPILNKTQFSNIEILLPPLEEQRRIATTLDKVSDLIAKRRTQLEKLDELVQSQFIELFGDINLNNRGWDVQPLGELCKIVRGASPRPIEKFLGGDIPWIKIGDATDGESIYLHSTKEHIIQEGVSKSRLIKSGSLIFANCGVSLGFARIITFDGCIHDGWLAMEDIDSCLDKVFLLESLNQMTEHFRKIAPAGTQPNLNTSIMKAYKQIIPPIQLQKNFISFVERIDKSKLTIQQSLIKLETLKRSLMQQYFG